ncbi:MAG: hypothetical protein KJ915_01915 [Candidatus Omnitrophica bacterium]|nr:hypothetical protein [Candidatus Omnitrophota bacterium]
MIINQLNPIYLILGFITVWIGVSALISLIGGWYRIAKQFPLTAGNVDIINSFSWQSLNLNRRCSYRSCVNIKIIDKGLIISTAFIFAVLHSPIFLAWDSMSDLEYKDSWLKRLTFCLGQDKIVIYGKAAKAIYQMICFKKTALTEV